MAEHIHKCPSCQRYTLELECSVCHKATIRPLPGKFSLTDKYGKYRREAKKNELREKGLY